MELAPIALFVYNRPWHTKQTIEALQKNFLASDSNLIIFSDGAKDSTESKEGVLEVREYLKNIDGFKSIKIIERNRNYGLAESIISGVSEIVNQCGKIIVLEDDMISSQYFLQYMNEALDLYANEEEVISIHSYVYPTKKTLPETFFLKGADCWGWATWKRGWDLFELDGEKLLKELEEKKLTEEFDFSGSYPYTKMLKDQIFGRNDSWAIRWYASAFLKNKLTLYPGKSLINNIGLDGSGTHCNGDNTFENKLQEEKDPIKIGMISLVENSYARSVFADFFRSQKGFFKKYVKYLKILLKYAFKN